MPTDYRKDLLQLAHEVPLAGHLGINKTYDKLIRHFYWPGIKTSTKKFCNSCDTCQKAGKPKPSIAIAPLKPITIKERPFERVIMDCVGPLPRTKSGNRYLLTIMCASSRFPEAIPLRAISTKQVVESMMNFFVKVGLPKVIQTDRGSNFMSNLFKRVIGQLGAKHVTSSPYHPHSQGALERFHATLKSMLRAHCTKRQNDWDKELPFVLFAIRDSIQESLGYSPFELVYGHELRNPLKIAKEQWEDPRTETETVVSYVGNLRKRLESARKTAENHMSKAQEKMRRNYDRRSKGRQFCKGEKVMTLLPTRKSPFDAKFKGPYTIAEKVDDLNYKYTEQTAEDTIVPCQSYKKIFWTKERIWDARGANRHSQNRKNTG